MLGDQLMGDSASQCRFACAITAVDSHTTTAMLFPVFEATDEGASGLDGVLQGWVGMIHACE